MVTVWEIPNKSADMDWPYSHRMSDVRPTIQYSLIILQIMQDMFGFL